MALKQLLTLAACVCASALQAADKVDDRWTLLRLGMTADEALEVLGEPLLKSSGRGFEIWTFDKAGEAVFYGSLVGWSTPVTRDTPRRVVDVWQPAEGQTERRPFILPAPSPVRRPIPAATPANRGTPVPVPVGGFRYSVRRY